MAVTQGHMDPFNVQNDDWSLYTERLGQFFVANKITDDKKVAVLLTVVGTRAYELLHSLLVPTVPSEKSYDELVKALQEHLNPKLLVITERFRFHHRNQQGETVAQYMAALRKHLEWCDYLQWNCAKETIVGKRLDAAESAWPCTQFRDSEPLGEWAASIGESNHTSVEGHPMSGTRKTHKCRRVPTSMLLQM